jgi:hypothetical protein
MAKLIKNLPAASQAQLDQLKSMIEVRQANASTLENKEKARAVAIEEWDNDRRKKELFFQLFLIFIIAFPFLAFLYVLLVK